MTRLARYYRTICKCSMAVVSFMLAVQVAAHDRPTTKAIRKAMENGTTCMTIVKLYMEHLDRTDQPRGLNSVSTIIPNALEMAKQIDLRRSEGNAPRPLECVPIVVKDNINVAGLATTAGSIALEDNIAQTDAPVLRRLLAAGAVLLAKTNMAEWAFSPKRTISSTHGETANPYDTRYVPAGSSGGTATAVASGFAVAGLGSDTGNSVRGPAAHAGLVGLRPGIGIIPIDGVVPLLASFDVVGPLTIDAFDAAVMMDVLSRPVGEWLEDYQRKLDRNALDGKIFAIVNQLSYEADIDPESLNIFNDSIETLRRGGADIVRVDLKPIQELLDADMYCPSFRSDVRNYLASNNNIAALLDPLEAFKTGNYAPESQDSFAYFTSMDDDNCPSYEDNELRQALADSLEKLLDANGAAAFVYPSWTYPPAKRDRAEKDYKGDNSQVLAPSSGLPAITFPSDQYRNGLPAGLQLLGRRGSEAEIISYAYAFELQKDGHTHIHPPTYRSLVIP